MYSMMHESRKAGCDFYDAPACDALHSTLNDVCSKDNPNHVKELSMTITVRRASGSDVGDLSRALGHAFFEDPVMNWIMPNSAARARGLAPMFATMARHHFLAGGGVEVAFGDGPIVAASLWDPPGRWKQIRREELRMLPGLLWALRWRVPVAEQVLEVMKQNHPEEPHWYLAVIGSDPIARGRGFGHALLRSRLDRCDAEHAPAYLESSNPVNVPYYERFGFAVTREIKIPDGGPCVWAMWRTPR
jgi:GNAT superfamily N-acetyltransferase